MLLIVSFWLPGTFLCPSSIKTPMKMWVQTWQQSSNVNHVLRFVYLFWTKQCLGIVLSIMLKLKHCDVSIQSRNILICIRNSHLYKRRPLCNPSYINVYMLVLVTDCLFFFFIIFLIAVPAYSSVPYSCVFCYYLLFSFTSSYIQ